MFGLITNLATHVQLALGVISAIVRIFKFHEKPLDHRKYGSNKEVLSIVRKESDRISEIDYDSNPTNGSLRVRVKLKDK